MSVPKRYVAIWVERLKELEVDGGSLEVHEYDGVGHRISPAMLQDIYSWQEIKVPPLK